MSTVRDNCDERQTPVERMIEEFRKARSRYLVKTISARDEDQVVESQRDTRGQVAAAGSSTTPSTSDSND